MRFFRADAAHAIPAIHTRLEEAGYFHAIGLPATAVLKEKIVRRRPGSNASTRMSSIGPRAGKKSAG